MAVGTGLFLGLTLLALIYLYLQTRDRWRWKRIGSYGLLLLGVLAAAAVTVNLYPNWRSRREPQQAYMDATLGATREELMYALGQPSHVLGKDMSNDPTHPAYKYREDLLVLELPQGTKLSDFDTWIHGPLQITFDPTTQRVNRIFCYSGQGGQCASLKGIWTGASEEEVIARLSKPDIEDIEGTAKILRYTNLNISFYLTKKRVYGFEVFAGQKRAAS